MAIATVKIAPIEMWCEGAKLYASDELKARIGQFVKINTDSMWMLTDEDTGETFRNWHLVGEDAKLIRNRDADSVCEHILEMD